MYDELVKKIRHCAADPMHCLTCAEDKDGRCFKRLMTQAADAIESMSEAYDKLSRHMDDLAALMPRWIPFETRPMDEEERQYYSEQYGFGLADDEAVIYCSEMPDHGQEVLVCDKYGNIWLDTFDDDPDYGVGFDTNGDMDGLVAWMPLPKPYEPPKEE